MEITVEFNEAAFWHGISKEDIMHALETKIHDAVINEFPEQCAAIGFDRKWKPLEIMYNPIDEKNINVFHAMKLRNSFIKMLGV